MPLTKKLVSDAYDVRLALELMAAEQVVGRLEKEQLSRLRNLATAVPREPQNVRTWHKANQALHEYQIDLADNRTASSIFRRLSVNLLMERALTLARDTGPWLRAVNAEHEAIVAAYEAGDLGRALQAVRAHNQTGRQIAERTLAQLGGTA